MALDDALLNNEPRRGKPVTATAGAARAGRIVALGDSLTAGYGIGAANAFPAILQARLDAAGYEYLMVNAGVSGDTSARGAARLASALAGDVRILILALGVNDGLRHVPVSEVRANLTQILEAARRRSIAVLLCGMEAPPVYGREYLDDFHDAYEELAVQFKVPLVPFVMLKVLSGLNMVLSDRMHPNAAGAAAIADQIWPYLQPLLRRIG